MALPHELDVPDDLLLPGVIRDVFAAGVASLVILANQEQTEGSSWTSIPLSTINELAHQHRDLVEDGQPGGEMFTDNPHVGVEAGIDVLTELGFIEPRCGSSSPITLAKPLIDGLRVILRR
jgi:hypothetical protein